MLAMDEDFDIGSNRPRLIKRVAAQQLSKSGSQDAADFLRPAVISTQVSQKQLPTAGSPASYKRQEMTEEQRVELQLKQMIE